MAASVRNNQSRLKLSLAVIPKFSLFSTSPRRPSSKSNADHKPRLSSHVPFVVVAVAGWSTSSTSWVHPSGLARAAGSRTGGRISSQESELDSPGPNSNNHNNHSTVHSWDSHANYHGNYGSGEQQLHQQHQQFHNYNQQQLSGLGNSSAMPWPRASHLIFYCDVQGHLRTATGLVRILLLVSSAACLATLCSSGTAKVSLFMLPLAGRLRFMIFVAVFCLLVTALLLFLDISHVVYFFPFNWPRLNAWIFTGVGVSYFVGSILLLLSVLDYHGAGWVPNRTKTQLTATAGIGLSCALLAFLLSYIHGRHGFCCKRPTPDDSQTEQLYKPVDNSSSSAGTLKERVGKQPPPWVTKGPRANKRQSSVDTNNGNDGRPPYAKRKDHWASTRIPSSEFEDPEPPAKKEEPVSRKQLQPQPPRAKRRQDPTSAEGATTGNGGNEAANGTANNGAEEAPGTSGTTGTKRKTPPKKLALQQQGEGGAGTAKARPRPSKDSGTGKKAPSTRTSVTRSEIQEYWMQGYDHVQRTEKTTGNIDQWQSAAMKSLQEKKARDAMWANKWRQQEQPDDAKPCSSKTLEPFGFA